MFTDADATGATERIGASTATPLGQYATISGGFNNTASNYYSTVGGGSTNTASGSDSTVSGGVSNDAIGDYSTTSGGVGNTASGIWLYHRWRVAVTLQLQVVITLPLVGR